MKESICIKHWKCVINFGPGLELFVQKSKDNGNTMYAEQYNKMLIFNKKQTLNKQKNAQKTPNKQKKPT